jgi:hypothetical protein
MLLCPTYIVSAQYLPIQKSDPVRSAERFEATVLATSKQHELDRRAYQRGQRQQFEATFNRLVDAVAAFSKQYNAANGSVWPEREAERLRKAMHDIQQLEKSLRDHSGAKSKQEVPASSLIDVR